MCGIGGIHSYRPASPAVSESELVRISERMASRGPDGSGLWVAPHRRVAFAHRRLAIIDPSAAGAQPMVNRNGTHVVAFNGEIYNFRALQNDLQKKGHFFETQSDTEVLLHLYQSSGLDMLEKIRGMFAFAIWDEEKGRLFLARDPYGVKPLYYSDTGGTFRFASSVKALLAGGALSRDGDPAGQAGFYLTGSVPEPFTTFRAIRALPAGSWMSVDAAGVHEPSSYFSIADVYGHAEKQPTSATPWELRERARSALLDSVQHHLVADVPVGAFLSSGVDSGALVGLMRDAGAGQLQTLTLSFDEFRGDCEDEAPLAAKVAQRYGAQHSTRIVTEAEFREDLPKIMEAMDQPSVDGINSWFVSKAVHELGLKVAISGLGGDELIGGYPSFSDIPRWRRWIGPVARIPSLGVALRQVARVALVGRVSPKACSIVELGGDVAGAYLLRRGLFMPWELPRIVGRDGAREALRALNLLEGIRGHLGGGLRSDFAQIATLESSLYLRNQLLRDTDWASMAHSLEVRVPLVDATLLKAMAPISLRLGPTSGKSILASAPQQPLPEEVVNREKTGFSVPVGSWTIAKQSPKDSPFAYVRDWARRIGAANFLPSA